MDKLSFKQIQSFTRSANYRVCVDWRYLQSTLDHWLTEKIAKLDMDPDFQRGHVWTEEQQIAFVEYALKGGLSGREIYFNCVGWQGSYKGPFELVDGKQRLTAVLRFLKGEIPAFGRYYPNDFTDKIPVDVCFYFSVNDLKNRKEVLKWYLEMNSGGTPHTVSELNKVREMIAKEK